MKRTLSLQRDTLAELTSEELSDVVGARATLACALVDKINTLFRDTAFCPTEQ